MCFRSELFADQSTGFRYYTLDENQLFKADNKEYVHFFFLLEGEVKISGTRSARPVIAPNEFFFIPDHRFVCHSVKESKFLLFSINKSHYQTNKAMYASIHPVITAFGKRCSPFTAPPLLSMFVDILAGYMEGGLDDESLQTLKQIELFLILQTLYPAEYDNGAVACGGLS